MEPTLRSTRSEAAASRLALLAVFALHGGAPLAAQPPDLHVRQLSPEGGANTDVEAQLSFSAVSPDGKWFVFYADVETDNAPELYSVRRFGGTPIRLSAVRPPASDTVRVPLITPDSRRVILAIDQETFHRQELWSVPIEGPAIAAIKLSPNLPLTAQVLGSGTLSDEGGRVAFQFRNGSAPTEVWSAPVDGSTPAIRLTPDLPPGAAGFNILRFTGDRAVFAGDFGVAGRNELWSVPINGSEAAIRISGAMPPGGDVLDLVISYDGARVLYLADQRFEAVDELFSVPVTGPFSAAVRVSPDLPANADVDRPEISADGAYALFFADTTTDGAAELWSAPAAGPASAATKLSGTMVAGGAVQYPIFESGGMVAYRADQIVDEEFELFLVPVEGPPAGEPISGTIVAGGDVEGGAIIPLGGESFALAIGDLRQDGKSELYSAPGDGSEELGPLFPTLPAGRANVPECGGGAIAGQTLFWCLELATPDVVRLYSVPFDRSGPPLLISSGVDLAASDVTEVRVDLTETWVYFRWDRDVDERFDLFRRPADGSGAPVRVHAVPVPPGADVYDGGGGYLFTPDGFGVAYLADHEIDEKLELYLADGMVFRADFEWGGLEEWTSTSP